MNLHNRLFSPILAATVISVALPCAACSPAPKIENVGGYRITYALRSEIPVDQQPTVAVLQQRLDAYGVRGGKVRKVGTDQIEITLPGVDPQELKKVQSLLVTPGKLEFRILAQKGTHDAIIDAATAPANASDEQPKDDTAKNDEALKSKWVWFDPANLDLPPGAVQRTVADRTETLIVLDDNNVDNRLLESVTTVDSNSQPALAGKFTPDGGDRMRELTSDNSPKGNVYQSLGVVLDDNLLLAPRIQESFGDAFMLTGNFTQEKIDFLVAVLRTGWLPVELAPKPVKIERVKGALE